MALRTCVVSYHDRNFRHSVEVMAETLHEAAVLGISAMNVPRDRLHLLSIRICVKSPDVHHEITGAALGAWLAQPGKTPREQALKTRLGELMRS
jgi:hypothetical protein